MRSFTKKYISWIIIAIMLILLIPGISTRIYNESNNDNVTVSLLYNDIRNKLSKQDLNNYIEEYKSIGVDTVSIMEDDLNSLMLRGEVFGIKFNELRYKVDDESISIVNEIEKQCPDVNYNSHVIIVKNDDIKKRLEYGFSKKYNRSEYKKIDNIDNMDAYVLYDGNKELWDYTIGYNEEEIKDLYDKGFKISLIYKTKNYTKTNYIDDIDRIVKEYNVEYLNIKDDARKYTDEDVNKQNYKGIAEVINNNDLTLVVTENTDHLSNQEFLGYSYVYDETMKDGGTNKVVRSYESYDNSHYTQRTEQLFNSTIDRNIRFITITQVLPIKYSYIECAEYTLERTKEYIDLIKSQGFTVNGDTSKYDYNPNKRLNAAASAVIMVMFLLIIIEYLSGRKYKWLTPAALIISALGFIASFIMPEVLLSLYPTVYCVMLSCFAMTILLKYIKAKKDSMKFLPLLLSSTLVILSVLMIGAIAMGAMLSGVGYYINNEIFRGIKLSLIVPVLYTAIVYYFIFIKNDDASALTDIKNALASNIKLYWVIIAAVIGAVGTYYIIRSGNVDEISSFEQAMRDTITKIFPARPRTKEFLIGYPSLLLFVYYIKHTNIKLFQWVFAVGTSILAASVTNSFSHVFTDFTVISARVYNGLLIGMALCVIVYIANLGLVKLASIINKKL